MQKDRQQALRILLNAIHKETRPQNITELKKAVAEISRIFFSDKAQQLFETGVSLRKSDLSQALEKVTEASRLEPGNFTVGIEMAHLMIAKNDCKAAQELIQQHYLNLVNFDEDLKLTVAQALVCQLKWNEYQAIVDSMVLKKSPQQKFWLVLEIEKFLALKNSAKALDALNSLIKLDDKYPETSYWMWKASQQQKKKNIEAGHKYVMDCKNISANQYRQYMMDPMLCRRANEVENELKGMNGSSE
ncbi:MAG: tetratricopeptide repeat protein [Bdellovibrio sp.]